MGKTTSLLIQAARRAVETEEVDLDEVEKLHLNTARELGVGADVVTEIASLLKQCRRILKGLALTGELSPVIEDLVMSFGERLSVRLFSGFLRSMGLKSKAWDAYDLGRVGI